MCVRWACTEVLSALGKTIAKHADDVAVYLHDADADLQRCAEKVLIGMGCGGHINEAQAGPK